MAITTEPREAVGLLLPTSTSAAVAFLALSSHGRVPAMLNYTSGREAILAACQLAGIRVVYTARAFVTKARLGDLIEALVPDIRVVFLEDLAAKIPLSRKIHWTLAALCPRRAIQRLGPEAAADDTAVFLFTSGSEGTPKGVALSHRNLLANCAQAQILLGLNHRDLFFNALPIFHCFGLTAGTLLPLLTGVKTFLYPTPLHYRIIPELCYEFRATVLLGTNSFFNGYAKYAHPYDLSSVRYVVAGAEKLHANTRQLWMEKFGIRILEGYGVTETSPILAVNTPINYRTGSVGRLMAGMECYLEPVEGIADGGRLVVRGPNVMRGYIQKGTAGLPTPPATARGVGWYDTGDIVRMDKDGFLYIIGRAKRFAKVGGEMVSLTAIEEFANRLWPRNRHASSAISDRSKGERIVLLTDHAKADRKAYIAAARAQGLGEILFPKTILVVDAIPLLPTGKIDYLSVDAYVRGHTNAHEEEEDADQHS
jgi:acyl-[acyl-carrier-protein]-phospholipid O-acyltransferase/long-chain-fatty-acid--[acyl-carrier-protein] ligase